MAANKKVGYIDAFFSSLMIGAGEAFFAAYALSQGLGELLAGLVVGLPLMMGALLQTLTPVLFERFARPKRWVLVMCSLQAMVLFILALTSLGDFAGPFVIFILIGLYWAFSYASGSVWNYWMGFLVPEEDRSEFFSFRLRLTQYGIILGLLFAGFLLQIGNDEGWGVKAYLLPFVLAGSMRLFAVYLMTTQAPVPGQIAKSQLSLNPLSFLKETWEVFKNNTRARTDLTFLFLFNSTIYISSSFVTPFLIAKLEFNYLSFMATQMALYFGKIAALFLAMRLIRQFGVRQVMFWGALGVSPLPALWIYTTHTWEAVILQITSGFFWGLFEVAVGIVLFSELPHRDKIQLLTWNNLFQATAIVIGTLMGGQILSAARESIEGYFWIFVMGAALRTVLVLIQRPNIAINSR